jgi:3,4-dihydroxy 2-butanone 4-phosphate synthase / GTP cyclohydrolase II
MQDSMTFSSVEEAIEAQRQGKFVVVVDDETRENEGDLILPAEKMTAQAMAFMVRHTSGVVCVALPNGVADRLALPLMTPRDGAAQGTAFTVTVDVRDGLTTGISARERAATIRALAAPGSGPKDFVRPGHVFPLRAHPLGLCGRHGHTEAASELAAFAGLAPIGALCEIVRDDGEMARRKDLFVFAKKHNLPIVQIADLVAYRKRGSSGVKLLSKARLPTRHGEFLAYVFQASDGAEHVAFICGDVEGRENVLVRAHSECLTGDLLGSLRCDCGGQLEAALRRIGAEGRGALIYLRGHEGRGIGLSAKLGAYQLQDRGVDTVDANLLLGLPVDSRSYDAAAAMLAWLGVKSVRLLTNNPLKAEALGREGVNIIATEPIETEPTLENTNYLTVKRSRMGHRLTLTEEKRELALICE